MISVTVSGNNATRDCDHSPAYRLQALKGCIDYLWWESLIGRWNTQSCLHFFCTAPNDNIPNRLMSCINDRHSILLHLLRLLLLSLWMYPSLLCLALFFQHSTGINTFFAAFGSCHFLTILGNSNIPHILTVASELWIKKRKKKKEKKESVSLQTV